MPAPQSRCTASPRGCSHNPVRTLHSRARLIPMGLWSPLMAGLAVSLMIDGHPTRGPSPHARTEFVMRDSAETRRQGMTPPRLHAHAMLPRGYALQGEGFVAHGLPRRARCRRPARMAAVNCTLLPRPRRRRGDLAQWHARAICTGIYPNQSPTRSLIPSAHH